jgi:hypothetical protein
MMVDDQRVVDVYLTKEVCEYLGKDSHDTVIETIDGAGGIFVHATANMDEEGSGIWVDAAGREHYGPNEGEFVESPNAEDFLSRVLIGRAYQQQQAQEAAQGKKAKNKLKKWQTRLEELDAETAMARKAADKAAVRHAQLLQKKDQHIADAYGPGGHLYRIPDDATPIPLSETHDALAETSIPEESQAAIMADLASQQPVDFLKDKKGRKAKS